MLEVIKYFLQLFLYVNLVSCQAQSVQKDIKLNNTKPLTVSKENYRQLTDEEKKVILFKGTEFPGSGKYNSFKDTGVFNCKQCNTPLFNSSDKFDSGCGWPSFDDAIENNVREVKDADGRRIEIICNTCNGHLGHVFKGERFTDKNTRHCVNSVSLLFEPENDNPRDTAIFASGCFWGTEYFLQQQKGVIDTKSGYIGGHVLNPSYRQVCSGTSGHAEAVRVIYNPDSISYEEIAKIYFETHDPTQVNGQGPDIGTQYRSEVFYLEEKQKEIALNLIKQLESKGLEIATKVTKASKFWLAEDYHQDYYLKTGKQPYCHRYIKRF